MTQLFGRNEILEGNFLDYSDISSDDDYDSEELEEVTNENLSDASEGSESEDENPEIFAKYVSSTVQIENISRKKISRNFTSSCTTITPISPVSENENTFVYGRAKKDPFEWRTVSNFKEADNFSLKFDSKINVVHEDITEVAKFFDLIFTFELLSKIVEYTNIRLKLKDKNSSSITINELKAFIGLLILFGQKKINNISVHSIWSPKSIHWVSWATAALSRERFQLIAHDI